RGELAHEKEIRRIAVKIPLTNSLNDRGIGNSVCGDDRYLTVRGVRLGLEIMIYGEAHYTFPLAPLCISRPSNVACGLDAVKNTQFVAEPADNTQRFVTADS